jgi:hypothetical protein
MNRLAEDMEPGTISLAYQGLKATGTNGYRTGKQKLNLGNRDTVVLDLPSNCAFMGTDSAGLPTEAVRAEDGRYHVIGCLTVAPIS